MSEMSHDEQRLLRALLDEVETYTELLDVSRQEHRALRENDVETVEALLGKKGQLTRRLRRLESERAAASDLIAAALGLPSSAALAEIAAASPAQTGDALLGARASLHETLEELASLNLRNALLLRNSLTTLGLWMKLMVRPIDETTSTYNDDGAQTAREQTRVLDRTA